MSDPLHDLPGWGYERIIWRKSVCGKFAVAERPAGIFHVRDWNWKPPIEEETFEIECGNHKKQTKAGFIRDVAMYAVDRMQNQEEQDRGKIFEPI